MIIHRKTFTPSQVECMQAVADGKLQKMLPEMQGKSIKTIETHMAKARKKVGATNTVNLIVMAMRAKIIV